MTNNAEIVRLWPGRNSFTVVCDQHPDLGGFHVGDGKDNEKLIEARDRHNVEMHNNTRERPATPREGRYGPWKDRN